MRHAPVEAFNAYAKSLPAQQGGVLIITLWLNAVLTLTLDAAQLALVVRALRHSVRDGRPLATVLEHAASPSTAVVLSASALHQLARERFARQLDRRIRDSTTVS